VAALKDTLVDQPLPLSCFRLCSEEPALDLVEKGVQVTESTLPLALACKAKMALRDGLIHHLK